MKVLLFGSSGTVGTACEEVFPRDGIEVVGLRHEDVEATDAASVAEALRRHAPDVVLNGVALIGNVPCEADPAAAFSVNACATYHMANACQARGLTFVHLSTHAVFDGMKDGYYTEDDVPRPVNIYGAAKRASEEFALHLCDRAYVFRLPMLYGPRRNARAGFVDKMLARARQGQPLRVAADRIDSPTYTRDAATRIAWALRQGISWGLYHIANHGRVSSFDFIRILLDRAGIRVPVEPAREEEFPLPGRRPLRTAMRSSRLPAMRPWEEALHEYVSECLLPGRAAPAAGIR